jgi:ABC-type dipeptide/oligopeptide/nickel transport system permease subunit
MTARPVPILSRPAGEQDNWRTTAASPAGRSRGTEAWRVVRHNPVAACAALVLVLFLLAAIAAPLICPYPPNQPHITHRLASPGTAGFLLGTDGQGRDMLSRLITGARTSLAIGLIPVAVAAILGLLLGSTAAFFGGIGGTLIMRLLDVVFGLPPALLSILVAACLGPGLINMLVAMTVIVVPMMGRVAHQAVTAIDKLPFIDAARASGATRPQILLRHILPSALPPVIVVGTSLSGIMIVLGSGLSFVGLGIQPPTADWGRMINDGRTVLPIAPHVATLPGIAIFVVASAFSLLGDALRDALDPRSRMPGFRA